jgi:hypothetical protein
MFAALRATRQKHATRSGPAGPSRVPAGES